MALKRCVMAALVGGGIGYALESLGAPLWGCALSGMVAGWALASR